MSKYLILFAIAFSSILSSVGRADVIFSIAKTTPGDVVLGSTATFDVFARTDTGTVSISVLGFDFVLDNNTGAGGQLTLPTESFLNNGWAIIDPYTALYDGTTGPTTFNQLTETNTLVGRITLSAANPPALAGTYRMRLLNTSVTPTGGSVNSTGGFLDYTISAVPEPTSMALVGIVGVGALAGYRRRNKKS